MVCAVNAWCVTNFKFVYWKILNEEMFNSHVFLLGLGRLHD